MSDELSGLLDACRVHGSEVSPGLRAATEAFLEAVGKQPELLTRGSAALLELPPPGAAWLAITFGSAVERGSEVRLTGSSVLALLDAWVQALPMPDDEADDYPDPTAHQAALLEVFPSLCQSAVTHLARMPQERETRAQAEIESGRLMELQGYSHGASWVREAVLKSSASLVVLHPPSGRGVRLRYSNVSNCFHLFSLLQSTVGKTLPGGRSPNAQVLATARGESDAAEHDEAWWHYGDPRSPEPTLGDSVWGEANVRSIPFIDDAQVLLIWPPLLAGRGWDSGFFGPHLSQMPADMKLERMLPDTEARERLQRLGVAAPRKWWQIG